MIPTNVWRWNPPRLRWTRLVWIFMTNWWDRDIRPATPVLSLVTFWLWPKCVPAILRQRIHTGRLSTNMLRPVLLRLLPEGWLTSQSIVSTILLPGHFAL